MADLVVAEHRRARGRGAQLTAVVVAVAGVLAVIAVRWWRTWWSPS